MAAKASSQNEPTNAGLCEACAHMKKINSARGSQFYLCRKSEEDPEFAKYPRLPVWRCSGFQKKTGV